MSYRHFAKRHPQLGSWVIPLAAFAAVSIAFELLGQDMRMGMILGALLALWLHRKTRREK